MEEVFVELLNGSKMKGVDFWKKFKEIVGCSFERWSEKKSTQSTGGSETYEYRDKNFILGGSAYTPPKLFKIKQLPQKAVIKEGVCQ